MEILSEVETATLIDINSLHGALAMWVARQHPYHKVDGVNEVAECLRAAVEKDSGWENVGGLYMRCFETRRDLNVWLTEVIGEHPQMAVWNTPASGHGAQFIASSRYFTPKPEHDFIDIWALLNNITRTAWADD